MFRRRRTRRLGGEPQMLMRTTRTSAQSTVLLLAVRTFSTSWRSAILRALVFQILIKICCRKHSMPNSRQIERMPEPGGKRRRDVRLYKRAYRREEC